MYFSFGGLEIRTGRDRYKGSGSVPMSSGQIRDEWDDPVLRGVKNGYLPNKYNLKLYDVIREAIPFIDVAIIKLTRLIGDFDFETYGNSDLRRKLDDFRKRVLVNYYGLGLDDFIYQMSDASLCYGYSVGELVVNRTVTDVERLKIGDSKTFRFKRQGNRMQLVQVIEGGFKEIVLRDNIFYLAFEKRNGHPQGISMINSLPYGSQILLRIEKAVENLYWRMGDPTFVGLVAGGEKTTAQQAKDAANNLGDQIAEAMKARREGKVKDIFAGAPHGGKIDIHSLGSDFKWPEIEKHTRLFIEQLVAKTGLPPFIFGLNWSTTERMSKDQNDLLVADTNYRRLQLEPHLYEILDTFLILSGDAGARYKINWKPVNLLDVMEQSRARYFEAFAMEKEILNFLSLIDNGWLTEEEVIERVRSDFRYRKQVAAVSGGNGKADVKTYLDLKKKQYARRSALNSFLMNELLNGLELEN